MDEIQRLLLLHRNAVSLKAAKVNLPIFELIENFFNIDILTSSPIISLFFDTVKI